MKIKNAKVYSLQDSIIRSGYPMQVKEPVLKGIIVQFDILYPQYFAQQLQRYNFVDIISSQ